MAPNLPLYQPSKVEKEAQAFWQEHDSFRAQVDPQREKFYCLSMFPYPSGQLHMGHVRNYAIGDAVSRYQGMLGKNVLQPIGWDAFGLPAENAALARKQSPAEWTYANIREMRKQLKRLGFAYDWQREVTTCKPEYYRWEQWFFIQLFNKGLIYKKKAWINWDPADKTVLANEQVIDGKGWRSGATVERRQVEQWFVKTTHYADELLTDLEHLSAWPEQVIKMQKAWIGKSIGYEISFALEGSEDKIEVFTTRPDTFFGVSYIAIAPEHPLMLDLIKQNEDIKDFIETYQKCPTAHADQAKQEKRGIDTGLRCRHPLTQERLAVWCANFVLMEYGSGAVMSVPAHDQRDWEFAKLCQLPIKQVIRPQQGEAPDLSQGAYTGRGILCNTQYYDGLSSAEGGLAIVQALEKIGCCRRTNHYRLRDWGISRQRYWGCPIPIKQTDQGYEALAEHDLPKVLSEADEAWQAYNERSLDIESLTQDSSALSLGEVKHETDTLDTFFESSWYYARFAGMSETSMLSEEVHYWLPVDQYIGGIEHAVLHLLYARLFHKMMRDCGLVKGDEPFRRLLAQGMVLKDGQKMSKSRGNTVDPNDLIHDYGADTIRLFVLFAAPPEQSLEWSSSGVEGAHRFLKRLWKLVHHFCALEKDPVTVHTVDQKKYRQLQHEIHKTIAKVSDDMGRRYTFNTAIAAIMKLMNALHAFQDDSEQGRSLLRLGLNSLILMLSPIVPHITHRLWFRLGHSQPVVASSWPLADAEYLQADVCQLVVQIDGKLRGRIDLPAHSTEDVAKQAILADPRLGPMLDKKTIKKLIFVPDRLINFVTQS